MYKDTDNIITETKKKSILLYNEIDNCLILSGNWVWSSIDEHELHTTISLFNIISSQVIIDGLNIESIDSSGVYFIYKIINDFGKKNILVHDIKLQNNAQNLFIKLKDYISFDDLSVVNKRNYNFFYEFGIFVTNIIKNIRLFLIFLGKYWYYFCRILGSSRTIHLDEVNRTIFDAGLNGFFLASLLSFLIGVTLTYQMSPQFTAYGANLYVVNFLGIALLKEVSPLLTAVIIAGRTGASVTAEIGTRKIQEELDALQIMGIPEMQIIVFPKVIGILIITPLVTSIADVASMIGGMIISNMTLSIPPSLFIARVKNYVSVNNFTCGIVKSIFFAFIIGIVSCYHGLRVKGNSNSIGEETTKSVVNSIILIVFIDAIFAIIFQIMGV